ncbi:hypothetical protein SAY86_009473 [Trapa natans]|uniref:Uncharacterized protein n=1 Tax=Trapa natans TaxID=22666 RepID=A0AAN7KR03_TRANT|nr:hypothetical protein SAY86_009473 [Trapa natans]
MMPIIYPTVYTREKSSAEYSLYSCLDPSCIFVHVSHTKSSIRTIDGSITKETRDGSKSLKSSHFLKIHVPFHLFEEEDINKLGKMFKNNGKEANFLPKVSCRKKYND